MAMAMAIADFFSSYSSLFHHHQCLCFKSCAINFRQLLSGILNSIHLHSYSLKNIFSHHQLLGESCYIRVMGLSSILFSLLLGCCLYSSANPMGKVEEFGGLTSYITGPADSKLALIMASDVYGYAVPHLRLIADKAAARGFFAVVPDFVHADPYVNETVEHAAHWKLRHPQDKAVEEAKSVIEALRRKGIAKIGAVGFCWGGKVAVDLTKAPSVEVGALLHPTEVSVLDIKEVKVPLSILGGREDNLSPPETILLFNATLKDMPEVDSFVKIYPKCKHGWSTRYNDSNEEEVKYAEETHRDLLDWLTKHLTTQNPSSGSVQVTEFGGLTFSFALLLILLWLS